MDGKCCSTLFCKTTTSMFWAGVSRIDAVVLVVVAAAVVVVVTKAIRKNEFFDNSLLSRVWKLSKLTESSLPKIIVRFKLTKITEFIFASHRNN